MLALTLTLAMPPIAVVLDTYVCDNPPVGGAIADDGKLRVIIDKNVVRVLSIEQSKAKLLRSVEHDSPTCCAFLFHSSDFAVGDATGITLYSHKHNKVDAFRIDVQALLPRVLLAYKDRLLILTYSGSVSELDLATNKISRTIAFAGSISSGTLSRDCKTLVVGCDNGKIVVFDLMKWKATETFQGHKKSVECVTMLNDNRLFSSGLDKTINVWSLTDASTPEVAVSMPSAVLCAAVIRGNTLCLGFHDGTIGVCDVGKDKLYHRMSMKTSKSDIHTLLLDTHSRLITVLSQDKKVFFVLIARY